MEAVVGLFSGFWQFQQFENRTGQYVLEFDVIDRRTLLDLLQIVLPEQMYPFLAELYKSWGASAPFAPTLSCLCVCLFVFIMKVSCYVHSMQKSS